MEEQKKSNFAGFIDGYRAGNLSTFSTNFRFKKNEIKVLSENIIHELESLKSDETGTFLIELKSLNSNLIASSESYEVLMTFGESLKTLITSFKRIKEPNTIVESNLKKVVYNFIDLAKKSEDSRLIDIAIEIGEGF